MGNSKIIFGNETLMDLTGDTVNANNLLVGATAHDRSGNQVQGTVTVPDELNDLSDVTITSASSDQILKFDGSKWVNGSDSLSKQADVTISSPADGNALVYDGNAGKWKNGTVSTVGDLDDLSDVTLSSPTSGQFLKYDGSKWVNGNGGGGASALDDLTDVDITTPADGEVLTYDSTSQKWVNAAGGGGGGFSYKAWLQAASISPSGYADLAAVLADEETVRHLMTVHDSVDYLTGFAASDTNIQTILNDNYAAKWINLRDYALDTLEYAFSAVMASAGKYGYGEWALVGQVPKMTSNTAPYGVASASSALEDYPAYKAFDGKYASGVNDRWVTPGNTTGARITYQFTNQVCIKKVSIVEYCADQTQTHHDTDIFVECSNDGTNWTQIGSLGLTDAKKKDIQFIDCNNSNAYLYLSIRFDTYNILSGTSQFCGLAEIQFYAWQPKGNVPIMTSNSAPYGEVSGNGGSDYYKAFDGNYPSSYTMLSGEGTAYITYKFTNPVCIKRAFFDYDASVGYTRTVKIQGSNDGSTWTDLKEETLTGVVAGENQSTVEITNNAYYLYVKVLYTAYTGGSGAVRFNEIQFYGRTLSVSVPTMTANDVPYGVASASSVYNNLADRQPWQSFKNNNTSASQLWTANTNTDSWIQYKFQQKTVLKKLMLRASTRCYHFTVRGSNDGTTFEDILTGTCQNSGADATFVENYFDVPDNSGYEYIRIFISDVYSGSYINVQQIYMWGENYSEYDWDTDTPRHYLYDHGVEPNETLTSAFTETSRTVYAPEKESYQLFFDKAGSNADRIIGITGFDFSSYDLIRLITGNKAWSNSTTYAALQVLSTTDVSANIVAETVVSNSNMTGFGFDVSAVSSTYNLSLRAGWNSVNSYSCEEWWLE